MHKIALGGLIAAIAVVLLLGQYLADLSFSVMALFGILIYFYSSTSLKGMLLNALLALLGFGLLLFLPLSSVLKSGLLASLGGLNLWLIKRYHPESMGPFFVMMIASLGGTINLATSDYLQQTSYLASGMLISLTIAIIIRRWQAPTVNMIQPPTQVNKTAIKLRSYGYALTIGLAYLLNLRFAYHHYNWLTVATAANLEAEQRKPAIKRYANYVLGNLFGVILAWLITQLTSSSLILLSLSALFLVIIAVVIKFNYCLALALATPLAIFLFDILHGAIDNQLLTIRLLSILVGSLLGIMADLLINHRTARLKTACK